jgi:hypothetical protein
VEAFQTIDVPSRAFPTVLQTDRRFGPREQIERGVAYDRYVLWPIAGPMSSSRPHGRQCADAFLVRIPDRPPPGEPWRIVATFAMLIPPVEIKCSPVRFRGGSTAARRRNRAPWAGVMNPKGTAETQGPWTPGSESSSRQAVSQPHAGSKRRVGPRRRGRLQQAAIARVKRPPHISRGAGPAWPEL